jgi:hypothetical protein
MTGLIAERSRGDALGGVDAIDVIERQRSASDSAAGGGRQRHPATIDFSGVGAACVVDASTTHGKRAQSLTHF